MIAVFDELLGVVPGTTGVRQENRHQCAGGNCPGEVGAERADAESEADRDRSEDRQDARCCEFAERITGADVDDLAVFGTTRAFHDSGDVAELAAHFVHHGSRRTPDSTDRQAREQEHDSRTDDEAHEVARVANIEDSLKRIDVRATEVAHDGVELRLLRDRVQNLGELLLDAVRERTEQSSRGKDSRCNRDSLGDGLGRVADRVELGEDLGTFFAHITGHFGNALGVVTHGSEGVHGNDDSDRGQQSTTRKGNSEQRDDDRTAAEQERTEHSGRDDQSRVDGRFEAHRQSSQDHGCRTGQ